MRRLDDPFHTSAPPRAAGWLEVGDGHAIAWSDSGPPAGMATIAIHGGPGGSMLRGLDRLVDTTTVRLLQFDQRGCGGSRWVDRLQANTLWHTVADMERLRRHLGIERWIVAGGSWGSTVALAYAQAHAERCAGVFLTGTWLLRERDLQWWFHGVQQLFPELWQHFAEAVPAHERDDLRQAYCRRILGDDAAVADAFAARLHAYEEGFMHFAAPLQPVDDVRGPAYGRLFAHYAQHRFFLDEGQLLRDAQRLAGVPLMQVSGRYDCCTTPDNAFALARALPGSILRIVAGAGHHPTEPAMAAALTVALAEFLHLIDGAGRAACA